MPLPLELTDYQITRYQTQHIVTPHYTYTARVDSLSDDEDSDSKKSMMQPTELDFDLNCGTSLISDDDYMIDNIIKYISIVYTSFRLAVLITCYDLLFRIAVV